MNNKLFVINIIWAVFDTFISALAVIASAYASLHFEKWWILFFMLVPLMLFNRHTLIINEDIEVAQKGDDSNS